MGAPGQPKTGGRRKGTPNRETQDIVDKARAWNCDPFEVMVRIAMDPKSSPELRLKAAAEIAQYILPKRRAVEVTHKDVFSEMTLEQLERMADALTDGRYSRGVCIEGSLGT
jgi:hypothetical protein